MPTRSNDSLVVPVEVTALAVNERTRLTEDPYVWHRWRPNFFLLQDNRIPPEPKPFEIDGQPPGTGVYVQWQLPEALTQGRQEDASGIEDFPLVPNRWLVVRHQAASDTVHAWVVESDHLGLQTGTVSYLDPHADEVTATKIGRRHDLAAGPWSEPTDKREPFLTALGPGLLTFSVFQPYTENVFSIHDPLDDVPDKDRLSYHAVGWYADDSSDILAGHDGNLTDLLEKLEWLAPGATSATYRSLYTGSVLGVVWDREGPVPASELPDPGEIAVAIGNSTAEALSGLLEEADGPGSLSGQESRLVRGLVLGTLDTLDRPNGDELADAAAHRSGFGPAPSGFTWHIADRSDPEAPDSLSVAARVAERVREQDVLAELNCKQSQFDALAAELAAAQERLYLLWALSKAEKLPPDFENRIGQELDPHRDGAARRVDSLHGDLQRLLDDNGGLPWGTTPEELEESAAEYASRNGMRAAHVLQRVPKAPHEQPADPVLLLQGAHLHAPMTRGSFLPCRPLDRLVAKIGSITAASVQSAVEKVPPHNMPAAVPGLLTEFFILDRAVHQGVDLEDVTGALPEYGTEPWQQAWQPLFLQWAVDYTALPYRDGERQYWTFDGTRYRWDGDGKPADPFVVAGRQVLAPTAGHSTEGKLAAYAAHRDDLPNLESLREEIREVDMLSQRLDGFSAFLAQRDPRTTLRPTDEIGDLVGHGDHYAPIPGTVSSNIPGRPPEVKSSDFFELRSGQLAFTQLTVVDRFGRAVNLFDNPRHFRPARPASLIPDHPVEPSDTHRFVELSPRLLQPARLGFGFLGAASDDDVDLVPGANPVCAWIVPNRLDRTLACYDPAGRPWGELRTITRPGGTQDVVWAPLPGSTVLTLDELRQESRHAHDLLAAIAERGPDTFAAVRATIDNALTTIDPDGPDDQSLGFLLGRPLALVRARLDLELNGPVRTSCGWKEILDPADNQPAMPAWEWIIRLGQATNTDDGLVGYVLNEDYDHLETIADPTGNHGGYLRPIGIGDRLKLAFDGTSSATTTLLLDPRAAVHATTDILPISSVHVPSEYTADALARMAICFRTGPLLAPTTDDPVTAVLPHPATATGTWHWTEPASTDDTWRPLPITVPDPTDMPLGNPEIRSGFLVLGNAADNTR
ncbi:hypothetical protein [Streptomyces noursei]|uniref:hypothetical protein n=1 Tax=Streptomyces noursei TaxID=1971 RepID=UPI0007C7A174|nr:hypothetical protein [Streptomyces noursei]